MKDLPWMQKKGSYLKKKGELQKNPKIRLIYTKVQKRYLPVWINNFSGFSSV